MSSLSSPAFWLRITCAAALLLGLCAACSGDDDPDRDAGVADAGPAGDGSTGSDARLYSCKTPGLSCNAHDPCAIDPICGKDKLCRPTFYQNCSDDLDCTNDTCAGSGLCTNTPKDGFCALLVLEKGASKSQMKCVKRGTLNPQDPCQGCNPAESQTKWSSRSGGSCDDGNPCTKGDTCQSGTCKGTYYGTQCSDALECTDDVCDGKGGCTNKMKSNYCLIGGKCYKDGAADTTGCSVCDASKNQKAWSARPKVCKVGAVCYAKGTKDASGCGVCDPDKSTTGWTAVSGKCLIAGSCLAKGAKDATGCGECDPSKSTTSYSPVSGKCLIAGSCYSSGANSASGCGTCDPSYDAEGWAPVSGASAATNGFESGLGGVTVTAKVGGVGWQVSQSRAAAGKASLRYGHSTSANYDNSKQNSGKATYAGITLPAGQKAALHFWVYLDVETSQKADQFTLAVGGQTVWSKAKVPDTRYRRWVPVEVDLSSLAGRTVSAVFSFDTLDAWANAGEGVYIDDLTLITKCGSK